ncbi:MAG: hotdog fold thioesterase [Chloroflexi bacterium]|nr:hotdog fold thioesterase [Chloroflexota bacterium]
MSERDLFARHLGIELLELRPGYSRVGLNLQPHMVNGLGIPHGSVIFALADFGFAAACNSHGRAAVALSMDIHFLRSPAPDARLEGETTEVRRGHRTALYRMTVNDAEGNAVAELHGMAYRKDTQFLADGDQRSAISD